ncbi:MAG: zf-TFIIB domain-containing protein, partial [Fibrobacteria bacterium]|nr:zf-TFIIB domain-containing protein [Fibrobacteria bacterium]
MSEIKCPNCKSEMKTVVEPDIDYEKCPKCEGIFLDNTELNVLATGMCGDIEHNSIDSDKHKDIYNVRACPKCENKTMQKVNLLNFSDTIFDYCPTCKGFYLDRGELNLTNEQLRELVSNKVNEEYRDIKDGYALTGETVESIDYKIEQGLGVSVPVAIKVKYFRIGVWFPESLNLNLRLHKEKWSFKFGKLFGINK